MQTDKGSSTCKSIIIRDIDRHSKLGFFLYRRKEFFSCVEGRATQNSIIFSRNLRRIRSIKLIGVQIFFHSIRFLPIA